MLPTKNSSEDVRGSLSALKAYRYNKGPSVYIHEDDHLMIKKQELEAKR